MCLRQYTQQELGERSYDTICEQLSKELPGLRGFSTPNLRKMRTFYEEWKILLDNLFVETNELSPVQFTMSTDFPIAAFMSIGFTHHYAIVSKVKDIEKRKFYIQFAADTKIKVEELEKLIKDDLYTHQGKLPNNFKKTIPNQLQAYRAITMFKDQYLLDFINVEELFIREKDRNERVVKQSIIQNVKNFIMTFGKDFTMRN